jgi:hypothetical protein
VELAVLVDSGGGLLRYGSFYILARLRQGEKEKEENTHTMSGFLRISQRIRIFYRTLFLVYNYQQEVFSKLFKLLTLKQRG